MKSLAWLLWVAENEREGGGGRGVEGRYPAHTRNVRMTPSETTFLPLSQENPLHMAAHTDK